MNIFELNNIEKKATNKIGKDLDMQLIEEMAELTQALCKLKRVEGYGQPTNTTNQQAWDNIYEELTDVIICLKEFIWEHKIEQEKLLNIEIKKNERTGKRLGIKK